MKSYSLITLKLLALLFVLNTVMAASFWSEPADLKDRSTWVSLASGNTGSNDNGNTNTDTTGDNSGNGTEDNTEDNTTDNTGDNSGDNTGDNSGSDSGSTDGSDSNDNGTITETPTTTPNTTVGVDAGNSGLEFPSRCIGKTGYNPSCPCTSNCWFTPTYTQDMCTCGSLEDTVALHEGKRHCVYNDQVGIATIGIGFNLIQRTDARPKIESLGLNYNAVLAGTQCLNDSQISTLFYGDIQWAKDESKACVSNFSQHSQCMQNLMIDMTFNLGSPTFCGWEGVHDNLEAFNYEGMYNAMVNSQWCQIVQSRCSNFTSLVKNCIS